MHYNVNKIFDFKVKGGTITSISVYISKSSLDEYRHLEGYREPRTSYNIAEFHGEEAIFRILEDIGFDKKINLNINEKDYETYLELSKFISDDARITFDDKQFLYPSRNLESIKKVILDEFSFVSKIKLDFGENYGYNKISYREYMFMYAIWRGHLSEFELTIALKKKGIVEDHLGNSFNYYSNLETDKTKVIKRIVNSAGITIVGVFLADISNALIQFKAIENGYNLTYKEDIPKDSIFYMSNTSISMMQ